VSGKGFGGYKANVVTYTVAKLANATSSRLDLDAIWKAQGIGAALERGVADLCELVQASITNPPRAANIGEWCKRPEAWTRVEALPWTLPDALAKELIDVRTRRVSDDREAAQLEAERETPEIAFCSTLPAQTWFDTAHWAKETANLQPWQRSLAFSLGQRVNRDLPPTVKQAVQGVALLREAVRLGFSPEAALPAFPGD